jgi:hypothetical protein
MAQLHKRFADQQIKELMQRYLNKELKREHIQEMLKIKRRQFFKLLKKYRQNPETFSIQYSRSGPTRSINPRIEKNIIKELEVTKQFIENKNIPIYSCNYSFVKNDLEKRYQQKVSLYTIIDRAKKFGFYIGKTKKHKAHDREVITNNVGELIQHDSSYHLWSPYAPCKWWLITSLDDFSRFLLFALLVLRDISLAHIRALQTVFLKYGLPLSFYVDQDAIFRFVKGRDYYRYKDHHLQTDETNPQWKQVIVQANSILQREVYEYNYKRIHSTTGEIPYLRYQRALKEKKTVFRQFLVHPPYQSIKDIFCFRFNRTVDAYRTVSIDNLKLKFNNAPIHEKVNLRVYPYTTGGLSEVRFWYKDKLLDTQKIKTELLKSVHF